MENHAPGWFSSLKELNDEAVYSCYMNVMMKQVYASGDGEICQVLRVVSDP